VPARAGSGLTARVLAAGLLSLGLLVADGLRASPARPVAGSGVDISALQTRAAELGLADETAWRRLLHYHPSLVRGLISHVDDPRFFLAGDAGRTNLAAELDATIAALFGPAPMAPVEADPRCRFVSRARWLRARLAPLELPPAPVCEAYESWRATLNADSLTLILPSSYLNNPSSMFGHTLLRIDPPDVDSGSDWLSWALNFAADPGSDAPKSIGYAFKGVTGGYPGRFSLEPYFRKIRTYGAIENRDIWEYRLNLTLAEVERLVEHVWELDGLSFDYYFFRENCSFRLLELFDHARPSLDLAAGFRFTAIPADTVRAVVEAGLVESVERLPSSATLLRHESEAVPAVARPWIGALAADPERADDAGFGALAPAVQRDTVVAANRLMTYRARREPPSTDSSARRLAMLTLLNGYPASDDLAIPTPDSPESGHDTTTFALGLGREAGRAFTEAALRLSYHDLLDAPRGYLPGAAIRLGELRVRADEDGEARLQSLDLIGIRSLGAPVPFLPATAWGVDVGLVRDELYEGEDLALRFRGLGGLSRAPGRGPVLLYALAGPSMTLFARDAQDEGFARFGVHARLGALGHGPLGGTRLELGVDALQGRAPRWLAELAHDVPLSRNRSLRARWTASRVAERERSVVALDLRLHF